MSEPLVSVIIPVYNVEKYLPKCLDSVWKQTYRNWEAFCVNDGSTDGSLKILEKYAAADVRFKVINQKNGGVSSARNAGLDKAAGEYVYFMDSDDFISPWLLETAVEIIEKHKPDCVCFGSVEPDNGFSFVRPENPPVRTVKNPFTEFIKRRSIFTQNLWTKVYRREVVKDIKFVPQIIQGQDLYFNLLAFYGMRTVILTEAKLYCYVNRGTSTTHQSFSKKKALGFLLMDRKIYEEFGSEKFFPLLRRNISNLNLKFVLKKLNRTGMIDAEIAENIAELKKRGAISYENLPLKMKAQLWLICRRAEK